MRRSLPFLRRFRIWEFEQLEDRYQPSAGVGTFAVGDVNGSGITSLITATPAGEPLVVRAIYGGSQTSTDAAVESTVQSATPAFLPNGMVLASLTPFGDFNGGASLAVGDFNGDGVDDIAIGAGPGGAPRVEVFDIFHNTVLFNQFVFETSFTGGVSLAAGDIDGDGQDDLIVGAGPGGGPHVEVYSPGQNWSQTQSFFAFGDPNFHGGVSLAAGPIFNINNDGSCDMIVGAGAGGGPRVEVYEQTAGTLSVVSNFFAGATSNSDGINVTAVTGTWVTGVVGITSAGANSNGNVSLWNLSANSTAGTIAATVSLGAQTLGLNLAGGGWDYPGVPILFAAAPNSGNVTVFGVQGNNDFYTVSEFNTNIGGKVAIQITPPNPNALAVLPTFETGTVTNQPLANQTVQVVTNFSVLTMMPPPPRIYHTPYILDPIPAAVISDYSQGDRANVAKWTDFNAPTSVIWGPQPTQFEVTSAVANMTATEQAQRLIAAAELLMSMGTDYQHHHTPGWLPAANAPWQPNGVMIKQTPGVDCSNFSAFIYDYALGFNFTGDTANQSLLTNSTQHISDGPDRLVNFNVNVLPQGATDPGNITATFNNLLATLQPGDLLFIDGTDPNNTTSNAAGHVIMWVGDLGNGNGTPLVIDCTGPEHIDSNGIHPPEGVQIRPFELTGVNSWYIHDMLSYTRIIPTS